MQFWPMMGKCGRKEVSKPVAQTMPSTFLSWLSAVMIDYPTSVSTLPYLLIPRQHSHPQ